MNASKTRRGLVLALWLVGPGAQADQLIWQSYDPSLPAWVCEGGPVVGLNGTAYSRLYVVRDSDQYRDRSRSFRLPSGQACRLDRALMLQPGKALGLFHASGRGNGEDRLGDFVEDISDGYIGVMNGPYVRRTKPSYSCGRGCETVFELLDCSSAGQLRCAGSRWGSWQVGLKFGASFRKEYHCSVFSSTPCVIEFDGLNLYWPQIGNWGDGSDDGPSGFALRYERQWNKALVLVQGGLYGEGFAMNPFAVLDDAHSFASPYCSAFAYPS